MTEQEQYLACAELDGFEKIVSCPTGLWGWVDRTVAKAKGWQIGWWSGPPNKASCKVPDYSTRDALVAVIEKQCNHQLIQREFLLYLAEITCGKKGWYDSVKDSIKFVLATPAQLREALLRATGKWKES